MLFNSPEFLLLFLPIVLIVYFLLNKKHLVSAANCWLIISSLFFYGYLTPKYVPILLFSVFFNYVWGGILNSKNKFVKKFLKKVLTEYTFVCYIELAMEAVFFLCLKTDLTKL